MSKLEAAFDHGLTAWVTHPVDSDIFCRTPCRIRCADPLDAFLVGPSSNSTAKISSHRHVSSFLGESVKHEPDIPPPKYKTPNDKQALEKMKEQSDLASQCGGDKTAMPSCAIGVKQAVGAGDCYAENVPCANRIAYVYCTGEDDACVADTTQSCRAAMPGEQPEHPSAPIDYGVANKCDGKYRTPDDEHRIDTANQDMAAIDDCGKDKVVMAGCDIGTTKANQNGELSADTIPCNRRIVYLPCSGSDDSCAPSSTTTPNGCKATAA